MSDKTIESVMTDKEKIADYNRLKHEYTQLHQDYRTLLRKKADLRNKLTPMKNLCAMLKDREVEPFMKDELNTLIDNEIKQSLINIEHLIS